MIAEHAGIAKSLGVTGFFAGGASALLATATTDPVALTLASKMAEGSVLLIILFFFFRYHEKQMELKQGDSDKFFEAVTDMRSKLTLLIEVQKETNQAIGDVNSEVKEVSRSISKNKSA